MGGTRLIRRSLATTAALAVVLQLGGATPLAMASPTGAASPAGTTRMDLEMPVSSAVLPSSFTTDGWAIDPESQSGTGIDMIHVYAYPNFGSGQPPIFLGAAEYGLSRPDVAGNYGQQFAASGFRLSVSGLAPDKYRVVVFAHNVAANAFSAYVYSDVTVAPFSAVVIDTPAEGATSTSAFEVAGWALDNRAPSGIGIDAVHVYASPNGGADPPVFLGVASLGWTRNDVAAVFGAQFARSGYHFTVTGMTPGSYMLRVYAHSTVTKAFSLVQSRAVAVDAATLLSIDAPSAESAVSASGFSVSGWAFDRRAANEVGVDALHVYACPDPGSGRAPIFLGAAAPTIARTDVAAMYGSQYVNSGYVVDVNTAATGLTPGVYDIVVWAHSSVSGAFTANAVVRVRLQ